MPGSVLDSFALIAYLRDEAGADKVENLLHKAATHHEPLHMTEVNYAEVQFIIIRKNGLAGWKRPRPAWSPYRSLFIRSPASWPTSRRD